MNKLFTLMFLLSGVFGRGQHYHFTPEGEYQKKQSKERKRKGIRVEERYLFQDYKSCRDVTKGEKLFRSEYNSDGKLIAEYRKKWKENGLYKSSEYQYNDQGQLITIIDLDESGRIDVKHKGYYKDTLLILTESFEKKADSWNKYYKRFYNIHGKVDYKLDSKSISGIDSVKYHYNINKKLYLEEHFNNEELEYKITYERLNKFDYIERIYEPDGALRLKRYWKFSEEGLEIERVQYKSDESIDYVFKKEVDCKGRVKANVTLDSDLQISDGGKNYFKNDRIIKTDFISKNNEVYGVIEYLTNKKGYSHISIHKNIIKGKEVITSVFCDKEIY